MPELVFVSIVDNASHSVALDFGGIYCWSSCPILTVLLVSTAERRRLRAIILFKVSLAILHHRAHDGVRKFLVPRASNIHCSRRSIIRKLLICDRLNSALPLGSYASLHLVILPLQSLGVLPYVLSRVTSVYLGQVITNPYNAIL